MDNSGFTSTPRRKKNPWRKYLIYTVMAIIAVCLLVFLTAYAPFVTIPASHTGVVTTFGKVEKHTLSEGFHLKNPLQRVILIDNLMTAIEDDLAYDLYRQQSAFVRKCVKLTKDLKILIFLVVHPRKMNGRDHFSNDDVSGSSNITNLADLTLNYTRTAKDFQTDAPRVLQLTKNRINGTMIFDGIPLYYEEESKRIEETPYPTKVKKYGWEDEEVWSDTDNLDDIPF
jgi:RecA-family ATPase